MKLRDGTPRSELYESSSSHYAMGLAEAKSEGKRMASGFIGNEVPRKGCGFESRALRFFSSGRPLPLALPNKDSPRVFLW